MTPPVDVENVLFWVVRHGRTASNDLKIYRGWSNDDRAQLDDDGRAEVEEAARFILGQGAQVELILTDTLDRTMETAEILAGVFEGARIVPIRGLHPLNVGEWTGTPKSDHPPESLRGDFKPPGGESIDEFDKRQFKTFEPIFKLVDTVPRGSVVLAGHGSNVSFLHNRVFKEKPEIGYEGLVESGGVLAVAPSDVIPLTKLRGTQDEPAEGGGDGERESAESAEYMELEGAIKDADCRKVKVSGFWIMGEHTDGPDGVSSERGCCDRYFPQNADTEGFKCGVCEYLEEK